MKDIRRLPALLNSALFFGALILMSVLTIFSPKSDFSELENRYLAEAPELSSKSWFSGDYSENLAEYAQEHFVLRSRWISLRTRLERLAGHSEVSGVYFSDGRLFEAGEEPDYERIDRSVEAINSFAEKYGPVSVMIVPTSAQIYADRLPSYAPEQGQRRMINYVYSGLSATVQTIDCNDALYRARDDYIYYRTDHHWTTRGAYIAYCECIRRFGYNPVSLDQIDIEHASHRFLGSYYSKVLTEDVEPDTVDIYTSGGAEVTSVRVIGADGGVTVEDSVYFREYLEKKDKYMTFLGENVPLIEISSDSGGGSVLVIKDSYANCFVPFLTKHFSRVAVADLRYMMRLSDFVDPSKFDRILILYNASTFASDANIPKLLAD